MVTFVSPVHPEKSYAVMLVTLLEMITLVSPVQFENTPLPATPLGIVMLFKPAQPANAASPTFVTVFGMLMPDIATTFKKALLPIVPTATPLIVLGIVTAPPGPVYPVIVICPPTLV